MNHDGELFQHDWTIVDTRVQGRAMAQVSTRDNPRGGAPLYSMRVGTAQLLPDGTTRISGHMSIYDVPNAIELLTKFHAQYFALREDQRRDLEELPSHDSNHHSPSIARSYRAPRSR